MITIQFIMYNITKTCHVKRTGNLLCYTEILLILHVDYLKNSSCDLNKINILFKNLYRLKLLFQNYLLRDVDAAKESIRKLKSVFLAVSFSILRNESPESQSCDKCVSQIWFDDFQFKNRSFCCWFFQWKVCRQYKLLESWRKKLRVHMLPSIAFILFLYF